MEKENLNDDDSIIESVAQSSDEIESNNSLAYR